MNTDTNKAPLLGKTRRGFCPCCRDDAKVPAKRSNRRREAQAVRKMLSNI